MTNDRNIGVHLHGYIYGVCIKPICHTSHLLGYFQESRYFQAGISIYSHKRGVPLYLLIENCNVNALDTSERRMLKFGTCRIWWYQIVFYLRSALDMFPNSWRTQHTSYISLWCFRSWLIKFWKRVWFIAIFKLGQKEEEAVENLYHSTHPRLWAWPF